VPWIEPVLPTEVEKSLARLRMIGFGGLETVPVRLFLLVARLFLRVEHVVVGRLVMARKGPRPICWVPTSR